MILVWSNEVDCSPKLPSLQSSHSQWASPCSIVTVNYSQNKLNYVLQYQKYRRISLPLKRLYIKSFRTVTIILEIVEYNPLNTSAMSTEYLDAINVEFELSNTAQVTEAIDLFEQSDDFSLRRNDEKNDTKPTHTVSWNGGRLVRNSKGKILSYRLNPTVVRVL